VLRPAAKLSAGLPEGYDHRPDDDKGAPNNNGRSWHNTERDAIDYLCHEKEHGNVNAEKPPEIPWWQIDDHAIQEQDGTADQKKRQAGC
jgi:hypothetical protein